jgi:hypothetical protein
LPYASVNDRKVMVLTMSDEDLVQMVLRRRDINKILDVNLHEV